MPPLASAAKGRPVIVAAPVEVPSWERPLNACATAALTVSVPVEVCPKPPRVCATAPASIAPAASD